MILLFPKSVLFLDSNGRKIEIVPICCELIIIKCNIKDEIIICRSSIAIRNWVLLLFLVCCCCLRQSTVAVAYEVVSLLSFYQLIVKGTVSLFGFILILIVGVCSLIGTIVSMFISNKVLHCHFLLL